MMLLAAALATLPLLATLPIVAAVAEPLKIDAKAWCENSLRGSWPGHWLPLPSEPALLAEETSAAAKFRFAGLPAHPLPVCVKCCFP